jgi:oligopeptide transport system substrate-binding protein
LVYLIGAEPATLDPAKSTDRWESYVIHAMFEGLTTFHPRTGDPMAALATHYEMTADGLRYRFYLRGHPEPRGVRLPNTETLNDEYRAGNLHEDYGRGRSAPHDHTPARWSDGRAITAHDVVYSWRRVLAPATAATYAYLLHYIRSADDITAGRLNPEELPVYADGDFCVDVELRTPASFFLQLLSHRVCCPVPRRAVEKARELGAESSWTKPGSIAVSGAFMLETHTPNDRIVLTRNPHYYEAEIVALRGMKFLAVVDGSTAVNLYRTGEASVVQPALPQLFPTLSRKKDFRTHRMYGAVFPVMNTGRAPFDDVRMRYALNMATDKNSLAAVMGAGREPALTLVPSAEGYQQPKSLRVVIDGGEYDVLSYDAAAARELFRKCANSGSLRKIEFLLPNLPEARPAAEILQQQWRQNLGLELVLIVQELQTWLQTIFSKSYTGVAYWGDSSGYIDPAWFLDQFTASSAANGTVWADSGYDAMLGDAGATQDPLQRMLELSACETYLLRGMPFVPLYTDTWSYLCKPFVKGIGSNPLDGQQFKYAHIDTKWRAT